MKEMLKRVLGRGKLAVLAVAATLVVLTASTAIAKVTTVKEMIEYSGTLSTAIMKLTNVGSGPALELVVGSGNSPLTVPSDAGTATNLSADELDGNDSTDFLASDGKAADADKLDGNDASEFLASDGTAADADKLDGKDSTEFTSAGVKGVQTRAYIQLPDSSTSLNFTDVASVTVSVPTDGYVMLTGNGSFVSRHVPGQFATQGHVFLTDRSRGESFDTVSNIIPPSAASGDYYTPFSVTGVVPATAGQKTFYLTGLRLGGDSVQIYSANLTALFVPTGL